MEPFWVCPNGRDKTFFYAHFMNDAGEFSNCKVETTTGVVVAVRDIDEGEELTLNYGKDYWENCTWAKRKIVK